MSKNYRGSSDIRKMADRKPVIDKLEYTNMDEYLDAQKRIHEQTFAQPAEKCELCGYPMDYQGHQLTEWERKWSTHEVCRDKMHKLLDRETGITRERRSFGQEAKPKKKSRRNPS